MFVMNVYYVQNVITGPFKTSRNTFNMIIVMTNIFWH